MSLVPVMSAEGFGQLWFSFFVKIQLVTALPLPLWPRRCGKSHVVHQFTQLATVLGEHLQRIRSEVQSVETLYLSYRAGTFWVNRKHQASWPFRYDSTISLASPAVIMLKHVLDTIYPEHAADPQRLKLLHEFISQPEHSTRLLMDASDWSVEVFKSGINLRGIPPRATERYPTAHAES